MGCSENTNIEQPLGCHPVNKKADSDKASIILDKDSDTLKLNLGGLQLTTSAVAKICYCQTDGCNDGKSDQFKIIMSGYIVTCMGILGIIGNLIAFTILIRSSMKSSNNYILIGKLKIIELPGMR